jgi:hypothetical protein
LGAHWLARHAPPELQARFKGALAAIGVDASARNSDNVGQDYAVEDATALAEN